MSKSNCFKWAAGRLLSKESQNDFRTELQGIKEIVEEMWSDKAALDFLSHKEEQSRKHSKTKC